MGTLLHFPSISPRQHSLHLESLAHAVSDIACQLDYFHKVTEGALSAALARIEIALANLSEIGQLLPPGEFKMRLALDVASLATQLDRAKDKIADLATHESGKAR